MKLLAGSLLLILWTTLFPFAPENAPRCTCRPSPPGGITQCQPGQIAICNGKGGVCRGQCSSPNAQLPSLEYSAALLSEVALERVTKDDLIKNPKEYNKALKKLVELSESGETAEVKVNGRKHLVCIGLSEIAKNKVKAAIVALAAIKPVVKPVVRPRIPSIRIP